MTLKEMREKLGALGRELEPLTRKLQDGTLTDDESARVDSLLEEINDIGPKVERAVTVEEAGKRASALTAQPNGRRVSGEPPLEGAEETEKRDFRPPVARYLESDEFKEYRHHPKGVGKRFEVGSFFKRAGGLLDGMDLRDMEPQELRALLYSGTASGSFLLPDVFPGIYRANERELNMRDVLLNAETSSDAVTILQESGFTNNAAEVAEATLVSEGAKPESAITLTEATFPVRTIAHWIPITRQMLDDLPMMRTYVEQRLIDGLERREDNQILNGTGVAPNLTGLYATSGTQALDQTYFTGAATLNVGTALENFDRILRAKTLIRTTGGATATFVVFNPADYEKLQTAADTTDRYIGTGPFTNGAIPTLWGLTVVESENNAAGTALVGDGTMAAVVDRMDATIYTTDSHSDYFIRNIIVILAEERIALPVFRPAAFAEVDLV